MNVLHIVPTFYPATYWGGPIYSTFNLCNNLTKIDSIDLNLRVVTTDSTGPDRSQHLDFNRNPTRYDAGYDVFFYKRKYGHSLSPAMLFSLNKHILWADVIHLTSVYSSPTILVLLLARIRQKPLVWSARGALQRWAGGRP